MVRLLDTVNVQHGARGRGQWELTSYEWNVHTGWARFGYTNRGTGEHLEIYRSQTRYLVAGVEIHMESEQEAA